MRLRRIRAAALGFVTGLFFASCGSVPRTSYYTLQIPPPPPANDPKTSFVLGVERFRATDVLRDDRIIYYQSPTELNFYEYHRWSQDPAAMLSELAARRLSEMGIFAQVRVLPSRDPVDYILKGRLLDFEEVDYETGAKGRIGLDLELVRSRDHKLVWTANRQAEHAVEQKGVPGVVGALNASADQLLREAFGELAAQVKLESTQISQKNP